MLDHTLERDIKYFGLGGHKNDNRRELYEIQLQVKKTVAKIKLIDEMKKDPHHKGHSHHYHKDKKDKKKPNKSVTNEMK